MAPRACAGGTTIQKSEMHLNAVTGESTRTPGRQHRASALTHGYLVCEVKAALKISLLRIIEWGRARKCGRYLYRRNSKMDHQNDKITNYSCLLAKIDFRMTNITISLESYNVYRCTAIHYIYIHTHKYTQRYICILCSLYMYIKYSVLSESL